MEFPSINSGGVFQLSLHCFDQRWNRDYRSPTEVDLCRHQLFHRAFLPYFRPLGWWRYSLDVTRFTDPLSPGWLGPPPDFYPWGIRVGSHLGEWPVTYHGTTSEAAARIVEGGYSMRQLIRGMYGRGIYSSPDVRVAERFSRSFWHGGRRYRVVLQNRIDVTRSTYVRTRSYWISFDESAIRPYGLLIRELYPWER